MYRETTLAQTLLETLDEESKRVHISQTLKDRMMEALDVAL